MGNRDFNVRNSCRQPVDAELRVHFDEHRHVVGHDFQGDDFSPIFFSGLSKSPVHSVLQSDQQARCADTWASTRNDICWNTPHSCSICTLLVPCLNSHLSNTSEIGVASQNTPYIPSPKGRGLYGAFSVTEQRSSFKSFAKNSIEARMGAAFHGGEVKETLERVAEFAGDCIFPRKGDGL